MEKEENISEYQLSGWEEDINSLRKWKKVQKVMIILTSVG